MIHVANPDHVYLKYLQKKVLPDNVFEQVNSMFDVASLSDCNFRHNIDLFYFFVCVLINK